MTDIDRPRPPDDATPLASLPILVLDFETTGLGIKRHTIVSAGGVRMRGGQILTETGFESLVAPGRRIPRRATRIHGLTNDMLREAPSFATVWTDILAPALRGAILVGHNIAFDIAHLGKAVAAIGQSWSPPPSLDTVWLYLALEPLARSAELSTVAERLEVAVEGRHTALGDSLMTAAIFARLLARLAERGILSFGEARFLCDTARQRRGKDSGLGFPIS
jgi:DNA polymerase-3 subunit epsilon